MGSSEATFKVSEEAPPWRVEIEGGVNVGSGRAQWALRTIDPETGELPTSATAGFLPPNDASHRGEGYVTFTVKPKASTPQFTKITNKATIVFDVEAPIVTNEVSNVILNVTSQEIVDYILGWETSEPASEMDFNGDGRVDASDVLQFWLNLEALSDGSE